RRVGDELCRRQAGGLPCGRSASPDAAASALRDAVLRVRYAWYSRDRDRYRALSSIGGDRAVLRGEAGAASCAAGRVSLDLPRRLQRDEPADLPLVSCPAAACVLFLYRDRRVGAGRRRDRWAAC